MAVPCILLHYRAEKGKEIPQQFCIQDLLAYNRKYIGDQDAYIISSNSIYIFYALRVF